MPEKKKTNNDGNLYCNLNGFVQLIVKHVQDTEKILKSEILHEQLKSEPKRGVKFSVFTKVEFVHSRFDFTIDEYNSTWYNVRNLRMIIFYRHFSVV